jgi:AmmeMemoRadiSam system protein B
LEGASKIETPLGTLSVDVNLRERLLSTKKFGIMERSVDEEEHSGEMQYPYIRKIINDAKTSSEKQYDIKVLPIMVGSIGTSKEESIGKLLAPFLSDRGVFTVISSDFCHCECDVSCRIFYKQSILNLVHALSNTKI